jgi:hypothetical protein
MGHENKFPCVQEPTVGSSEYIWIYSATSHTISLRCVNMTLQAHVPKFSVARSKWPLASPVLNDVNLFPHLPVSLRPIIIFSTSVFRSSKLSFAFRASQKIVDFQTNGICPKKKHWVMTLEGRDFIIDPEERTSKARIM